MEQNQNPEVTLVLNLTDINKISEALSELKLKDSIDVFMKVREQTVKQLQPPIVDQVPAEVVLPA
jgi:type II secretory pathway component PulC